MNTQQLADVFTPTRPKAGRKTLVGRRRELARILEALLEERAHVVLHSERGRGKTSLSNAVIEALRSGDVAVARYTCNADSGFDDIMISLMRDLPSGLLAVPVGGQASQGCEAALPAARLSPSDVACLPSRLTCRTLVCVIDEFDRVEQAAVRRQVADSIKQLSDRGARLLFMIIGVSDNLGQLIGSHLSIRRNVVTVPLPLMPDADIRQLIVEGARRAGFEFSPALVEAITGLSRGMPYIAQVLGLRVTQAATARGESHADATDLRRAAERLVEETEPRVADLHAALTERGEVESMNGALRAAATAEQDVFGFLQAAEVGGHIVLGSQRVASACYDRLVEAGVLRPLETGPAHAGADFKVAVRDRDLLTYVMLLDTLKFGLNGDAAPAAAAGPPVLAGSIASSVLARES